jgi:hypothetical protein
MAALSSTWPTLLDVSRRLDGNGNISAIAEVLTQQNEILDDIPMIEGNLPTGHKTTIRQNIPAPTWRLLNQGVTPVKSVTGQITETCGMMENYAEVDKSLADLNGNTAKWRLSEDKPIIEGMNQAYAYTLIYGDSSINPEKFVGLAPRYFALSGQTTSANMLSGLGSGSDNTSIWLVVWSEETVHGIFPKGSKAGLTLQDLGEQTLIDASGGRYQGYRTHYKWDCGLAVRDWRYVVRICNIDVSDLLTAGDGTDTSANLIKLMSRALDAVPNLGAGRPVFYMHNTVRAMLRVKLLSKSNVFLSLEDIKGANGIPRPTLTFMGVPCRRVDQMALNEATIS